MFFVVVVLCVYACNIIASANWITAESLLDGEDGVKVEFAKPRDYKHFASLS